LVEDWRWVLVVPFEAAEACSTTSTVTMSSTSVARRSRPRSVKRDDGVQIEPGEENGSFVVPALRRASSIYRSRAVGSCGLLLRSLGMRAAHGNTNTASARTGMTADARE